MSSSLTPIAELPSVAKDPATQPVRVTWDLAPSEDCEAAAQATPGPSTPRGPELRRDRFGSRAELVLGVHPQLYFLPPRAPQPLVLVSVTNSSEAAVKRFLPKNHLSRVIIRDNLSAQRICEVEIRASEKTKKKMSHLHDHLKKKFMLEQLQKLGRWRRESMSIRQYLYSLQPVYKFQPHKRSQPP
nr:uncharacterized protein C5orf52 homolog isoform X1 [Oryctolagus cuniculus]